MSKFEEYRIWSGVLNRCNSETSQNFKNYKDRGITVCDEWTNFENFYRDLGPRPSKTHSIDRINNSLGYFPGNCRWATQTEQCNNTRKNVRLVLDGESKTLTEWSRIVNISLATLSSRKLSGLSDFECLMMPVKYWGQGRKKGSVVGRKPVTDNAMMDWLDGYVGDLSAWVATHVRGESGSTLREAVAMAITFAP